MGLVCAFLCGLLYGWLGCRASHVRRPKQRLLDDIDYWQGSWESVQYDTAVPGAT